MVCAMRTWTPFRIESVTSVEEARPLEVAALQGHLVGDSAGHGKRLVVVVLGLHDDVLGLGEQLDLVLGGPLQLGEALRDGVRSEHDVDHVVDRPVDGCSAVRLGERAELMLGATQVLLPLDDQRAQRDLRR